MRCEKCDNECTQESCDVGVGTIYGPWGCQYCGWSECEEYDRSEGQTGIDERGGFTDQWGVYYPPANPVARAAVLAQLNTDR
jgi:hypothetical protein